MRKLVSANFFRLFKDKFFWLCMAAMFLYCVIVMFNARMDALPGYERSLDGYVFHVGMIIGAFGAFFVSMFLGTEYSDGTIRNKIVVGHTRTEMYLANLLCVFAAVLLMVFTWLAGVAAMGIPVLGACEMRAAGLALYLLILIMLIAAFSAIFTCTAMLSDNKAVTVVISVLLFFGLFMTALFLYNALDAPEIQSFAELAEDGTLDFVEEPNPRYVSGVKRKIYEFILDFLPTGQGMRLAMQEVLRPVVMLISSVGITLITSFGGILAFKRKNLK